MITVCIFTDKPHRYAFTKDSKGANLPDDGYGIWKQIETRHYSLNDNRFPLLPITSNQIKDEIEERGYFVIDLDLFNQS